LGKGILKKEEERAVGCQVASKEISQKEEKEKLSRRK